MTKRARPKAARVDRKTAKPDRQPTRPSLPLPQTTVARPNRQPEPPPPRGPAPEAVRLFQAGMEALQRHQYDQAADAFNSVISEFPAEPALIERARVYLELCRREQSRRPTEPKTVEERITAATAALNDGNNARAEELARRVLAEDPHQDMALYLLTVVEARRGATDAALAYLSQTIALSPEARAQARHDPDFEALRQHPGFLELTDPPAPAPGIRRIRPRRSER